MWNDNTWPADHETYAGTVPIPDTGVCAAVNGSDYIEFYVDIMPYAFCLRSSGRTIDAMDSSNRGRNIPHVTGSPVSKREQAKHARLYTAAFEGPHQAADLLNWLYAYAAGARSKRLRSAVAIFRMAALRQAAANSFAV